MSPRHRRRRRDVWNDAAVAVLIAVVLVALAVVVLAALAGFPSHRP